MSHIKKKKKMAFWEFAISVVVTQYSLSSIFGRWLGCTPLVMHWGAPGWNCSCPCRALFQEREWYWAAVPDSLGRITFLGRGATSKAGIGFLDGQRLSITDNLEIAMGSDTVEILKVAIIYIAHRLDLKSVCASAYLLIKLVRAEGNFLV